jgi:hypothetical protein
LDERLDLVSDTPVMVQGLLLSLGFRRQLRWIVESYVDDFGLPREDGAILVGMTANGYNVVELDACEFTNVLRAVTGNVYARLLHNPNGVGIEAMCLDSRGIGLNGIALEMSCPTFRHLAAA